MQRRTAMPDDHLVETASQMRERALLLHPGATRDEKIRKARLAAVEAQLSGWLDSPGLQPPN